MAACAKVFAIYELIESVMLDLPLYDLLVATCVSGRWRRVALTSTRVRERLLIERIPAFVPFHVGRPETDDLCNASHEGPWFFRTVVDKGHVVLLRTRGLNVQIFLPGDEREAVQCLDGTRTRGAHHMNHKIRTGWANFYDVHGSLVCSKTVSMSPWLWPARALDNLWDYVRTFNAEETRRYRTWVEMISGCEGWEQLLQGPHEQTFVNANVRRRECGA